MEFPKARLEALSDGVIAIILTIMVLSIPLPDALDAAGILSLLGSIGVYLLSFLVVGAFWSHHHHIFHHLSGVTPRLIAIDLAFLFFLSLIPILTKWVIENPGRVVPAIGYDLAYLFVHLFYMLIFDHMLRYGEGRAVERMRGARGGARDPASMLWSRFLMTLTSIALLIGLSFLWPVVTTWLLLGMPVVSSVANLLLGFDHGNHERHVDRRRASAGSLPRSGDPDARGKHARRSSRDPR